MQDLRTFERFQAAFAARKDEDAPTLDHGSKRGLHRTLASIHKAVFAGHVTTLDEAKARLQTLVDIAGAGADEEDAKKE